MTPVPSARRGQVLAFIDGVPGQLGTVLHRSAPLLGAATVGVDATSGAALRARCCGGVRTSLPWSLFAATVPAALLATLREGPGSRWLEERSGLPLHASTQEWLRSCGRPCNRTVRVTVDSPGRELSNRLDVRDVVIDVVPLVDDPEPSVRRAALATVGQHGNPATLDAVAPGPSTGSVSTMIHRFAPSSPWH